MKRVVIIVVTLVLSAMLYGCHPPVGGDMVITPKSFIGYLTYAREIELFTTRNISEKQTLFVGFDGYNLTGERKEKALEAIGDMNYNQDIYFQRVGHVLYYDFVGIDIVSSAQFGDVAPGESLTSKVLYGALSIKPFIDSGYTLFGDWDAPEVQASGFWEYGSYDYYYSEWQPIVKPLNEVTRSDMELLESNKGMMLKFTEVPEVKEHTFTVTIVDEWGHVMTASVDYVFE